MLIWASAAMFDAKSFVLLFRALVCPYLVAIILLISNFKLLTKPIEPDTNCQTEFIIKSRIHHHGVLGFWGFGVLCE